jgi:hypothetical protein
MPDPFPERTLHAPGSAQRIHARYVRVLRETARVADPVAIISVVSGATVAVAVPLINARLEQNRLREQRTQERFAELRTVLDGAAERLIEGHTVWSRMMAVAHKGASGELADLGERFTEVAVEVFRDDTRLFLRLGESHEAVAAHQDAQLRLHEAEGRWRTEQTPPGMKENTEFGEATSRFLSAAHRVVAVPTARVVIRLGQLTACRRCRDPFPCNGALGAPLLPCANRSSPGPRTFEEPEAQQQAEGGRATPRAPRPLRGRARRRPRRRPR